MKQIQYEQILRASQEIQLRDKFAQLSSKAHEFVRKQIKQLESNYNQQISTIFEQYYECIVEMNNQSTENQFIYSQQLDLKPIQSLQCQWVSKFFSILTKFIFLLAAIVIFRLCLQRRAITSPYYLVKVII